MPSSNATSRFSDRVENYLRYRPGYPPEVMETLRNQCGLTGRDVIADIASGTGIWTRMLLENGNQVYAVEPNKEMRTAGEKMLAEFSGCKSITGTAEDSGLPNESVDFVTAAQAAHWFNRGAATREFRRILRPGGWLVLMWNERVTDSTPFLREYEQLLLKYGTDYQEIRHERTTDEVHEFFAPAAYEERVFLMQQEFDYAGVEGRLLSSSYAPGPEDARHLPMLAELKRIFASHARGGRAVFEYKTRLYFGRLR